MRLPILAPLGLVSFPTANVVWLLISLGLIGVIVVQTAWWARVQPHEPGFLLLAAAILALSPFHTTVAQGQLSIATTVLVLLALRADHEDSPWTAGLLLALGTRIALLCTLSWILELKEPLFELSNWGLTFLAEHEEVNQVSWRDIILLCGGLFLIGKSVIEIHDSPTLGYSCR